MVTRDKKQMIYTKPALPGKLDLVYIDEKPSKASNTRGLTFANKVIGKMDHNIEWRPIKGYEGIYEVSEYGQIKSLGRRNARGTLIRERILKPWMDRLGYVYATLSDDTRKKRFPCHRLVAQAFIGDCPDNMEVNHKDGNKLNNHHSNLEYVTHHENMLHSWRELNRIATVARGSKSAQAKLSEGDIEEIRRLYHDEKLSQRTLGKMYRVSSVAIGQIIRRKSWVHIETEYGNTGRDNKRADNPNAKLGEADVETIRDLHRQGYRQVDLAKMYGVTQPAISHIIRGKSWG